MKIEVAPRRTLSDVVGQYVQTNGKHRAISTADAILAVRSVLPDCALSDGELANLIAEAATARGYPVIFDSSADIARRSRAYQ